MKYIDVQSVARAYKNFQDSMTNKSWGVLCIMKQLSGSIVPGPTYAINCAKLSTFIENLFCLSDSKKEYNDNGKNWYVKFSTNWDSFFFKQKQKKPNIYDIITWVYRNEPLPDNVDDEYLIQKFTKEFNINDIVVKNIFECRERNINYISTKYKERELLFAISKLVVTTLDKNITAECKSIAASPGELSRGPFIQTLYAALDTTDYVLISQTDFDTLYPMGKDLPQNQPIVPDTIPDTFRPFLTAIRSKPFLLLAGISGTGKSRIVRELARACWDSNSEEYKAQKPKNFEMIQVKPNWHDSTELIGYISRVSGAPEFVAGDFLKFVVKAWEDTKTPYFLCLDEMNLAPVEQYFAEYLSVIESRKFNGKEVVTDPILKKEAQEWYHNLVCTLTEDSDLQQQFLQSGISIPKNLIVIGTVNMDETTFAFSRKVLDRAMTIEMNEVDLHGGLTEKTENIGKITFDTVVGNAVEGVDVYANNQEVCDTAIDYLQSINDKLNGTPFKIAYRTRNEFLLYVVNNLPYSKDEKGNDLNQNYVIARALDEITSMKILSRIEGDEDKTRTVIEDLKKVIDSGLKAVCDSFDTTKSVSLLKLNEMEKRLSSGYTSFWS